MLQLLGQYLAALFITLNNFDVVTSLNALGQAKANITAAGNNNTLIVVFQSAQLTHYCTNVIARGNKKYFVIRFRSEERRVGKERRPPGQAYHSNKNEGDQQHASSNQRH